MADSVQQGLLRKHTLTAREMAEVEQLSALSYEREGLLMPLDHNTLGLSTLPTDDIFLYYVESQLVGYLLLDRYHSEVKETTGLVHPEFRRRGIFGQLFAAARQECRSRGIRQMLFVCETTSSSGRAWLYEAGAGREFAEHFMVLGKFQPRAQDNKHLRVHEASSDDLDALAFTLAADFGDSREKALQYILPRWEEPNQRFYLATYYPDERGNMPEPVGTLRVEKTPERRSIYGFFVREEYRGHGYGRQLLETVIVGLRQNSQQPVTLDVDTNNLTALNLYRSCGFEIERTYEYYGLAIE